MKNGSGEGSPARWGRTRAACDAEERPCDAAVAVAVRRAKRGDRDGLHLLYRRYASDVRRYVESIVRDPHEAEDITQTVFTKLVSSITRYEERDVPFTAWIVRVARNAALDHLRVPRPIPSEEVRGGHTGSAEVAVDRRQTLRLAMDTLSLEQRQVLALRHVGGFSPPEIAVQLGKSESAVHGLHHRGRGALRSALVDLGLAPTTRAA